MTVCIIRDMYQGLTPAETALEERARVAEAELEKIRRERPACDVEATVGGGAFPDIESWCWAAQRIGPNPKTTTIGTFTEDSGTRIGTEIPGALQRPGGHALLASIIAASPKLTDISTTWINLGDTGTELVAKALTHCPNLESWSAQRQVLGDDSSLADTSKQSFQTEFDPPSAKR